MYRLQDKQEIFFPTRIVKVEGTVENPERLLAEKPLALLPTCNESTLTRLSKQGEARSYMVLDFGIELHGSVRLLTQRTSKLGMKLRLVFGESVTEALSHVGERGATNHHSPRDIEVEIANLSILEFGCTGFRFCRIEAAEEGSFWFKSIAAVRKTADIREPGYIRTSDERLNRIIDTARYTAYLNMQNGVIWDGIKRDRMVWSGDLNTEILTAAYSYGAVPHIKNCLELLRRETPDAVWMNNIPSYSVWWILNLIDYYRISGDRAFFEENLDYVHDILRDLDACIGESRAEIDMERTGKRTSRPFFLDWPTAETEDAFPGTMMLIDYTLHKLLCVNLGGIDRPMVSRLLERIRAYRAMPAAQKETIAMQVMAGGGPADAKERLEADGATGFSTFMMYFILNALDRAGSRQTLDLAKAYYGGMLDRGATTFWEDFDMAWLDGSGRIDEETPEGLRDLHADYGNFCYKGLRHSLCHGWSSGIVGYAVERLLGLVILEPGYAQIAVCPDLHGLDFMEGRIPTPHGDIFIRAEAGREPIVEVPRGVAHVK